MTAIALGLTWAAVVALVLGERRVPVRLPYSPRSILARGHSLSPAGGGFAARARGPAPVTALGAWLRRRAGRPADPDADRRVGRATLAAVVAGAVGAATGHRSGGMVAPRSHADLPAVPARARGRDRRPAS